MAMDDDTDDGSDDNGLKALRSSIDEMTDPTTSTEAQDYAKRILSRNLDHPDTAQEADLMDRMERQAADARSKLVAAREKLAARKPDTAAGWFSLMGALGSPTKTGNFGETLGNVGNAMGSYARERSKDDDQRDKDLLGIDSSISGVDQTQIMNRLALLKSQQANDTKLSVAALSTLGKRLRGGANGQMSKYGKIAQDEGHTVGSPEFNARVHQLYTQDMTNQQATAGTDSQQPDMDALRQLADSAGVPLAPSPFTGLSTKDRRQAEQQAMKDAQKQLDAFGNEDVTNNNSINMAQRFNRLIDKAGQSGAFVGAVRNLPVLGGSLSSLMGGDKTSQQLDQLTAIMSRAVRAPGEGSTSDYDAKMFKEGTVDRAKGAPANHNIARAFIASKQNELARHQFFQDYYSVNHHVQGAASAWQTYLNANPIFDPSKNGEYVLNPHRMSYKDYFRAAHGDHGTPVVTEGAEGYDEDPGSATSMEVTADDNLPAKEGHAEGGEIRAVAKAVSDSDLAKLLGKALAVRKVPPADLAPLARLRNPHVDQLVDKYTGQFDRNSFDPVASAQDQLSDALTALANRQAAPGYADGGEVETDPDAVSPESWEDIARSLGQGASFSFEDELAGSKKKSERSKLEKNSEDHPVANELLQMLGTAAPASLAMRALPEIGVPASLMLAGGSSLLSNTGASEGAGTIPGSSVVGTLGGALGASAGYAGSKGLDALRDAAGLGLSGADKKMGTAINADNMTPEELGKAIIESRTKYNVPSMAVDEMGDSGARLARMAMQQGSGDSGALTNELQTRNTDARSRVEDRVNRTLKPDPFLQTDEDLTNELRTNAKPLYDQAHSQFPYVKSDELFQLMNTAPGKKAAKQAFQDMQTEGIPIGQADAKGMVRKPSLQYLDYVKRALDRQIQAAKVNPSGKNDVRILSDLRNRFVNGLDAATTDPATGDSPYKAARGQYAGDLEVLNALHSGRQDFMNESPESLQRKFATMSNAEKEAYKSGVAESIFRKIGKPSGEGYNAGQAIAGSPDTMAKMQAILSPGEFKVFQGTLQREAANFSRSNSILKNAGKLPGNVTENEGPQNLFSWFKSMLPGNRMSEDEANEVARTLQLGSNKDVAAMIERLKPVTKTLMKRKGRAGRLAGIGAIVGGTIASPRARPQTDDTDAPDDEEQ